MPYFFFLSVFFVLICSGCTVGPDFERPQSPLTQSYTADGDDFLVGNQKIEDCEKIEKKWWTLFGCQLLNTAVDLAVSNNNDIAASQSRLAQAREMVKVESGALWPQFDLNGTIGRQKYGVALFGPSNISIPPFTYYEIGPSTSLLLDVFGGKRRSIERQEALAAYQTQELNAVYISLIGNIVAEALSIAALRAQIKAIEKLIDIDEHSLILTQEAYRVGETSQNDIIAAQSQLENDRSQLPLLNQQLSIARNALSILVGKAPAEWSTIEFDLEQFTLPQKLPITLPSELVHQRPDILAAEANLHAASAAIGIATANFYPQITLTANFAQQALTPGGLFKTANNAWAMASSITNPLFKGGTLDAEKSRAEEAYKEAFAIYKQTILKALGDVANNLKALHHNEQEYSSQKKALHLAQKNIHIAQRAHKIGGIGLLKTYEVQRHFQKTKIAYIRALAQQYQHTAQFFVLLGYL